MGTASNRLTVSVRIAGHDYKIRGEGDAEGLVRIAGYVDRAMDRVRARTGTVDSLDVAVLTCLNLAREILALHEQRTAVVDDDRIRSLIEKVESVVGRGYEEASPVVLEGKAGEIATTESSETPRTLDLSTVEDLRDRRSTGLAIDEAASGDASPLARAAGGRDRVG